MGLVQIRDRYLFIPRPADKRLGNALPFHYGTLGISRRAKVIDKRCNAEIEET